MNHIAKPPSFSRDYLVHYYEIGRDCRLTLPSLMHYFEDIATIHSESVGLPLDHYLKTGCVFMLIKWDIAIRRWPRFNESIRIETCPTSFKRFMANREYFVYEASGEQIAHARSLWIFADLKVKKATRPPPEILEAFSVPPQAEESFDPLEEFAEITGATPAPPFSVGKRDLDNNGHVNNVRYVEWATESLPADFTQGRAISGVKIHYKKELLEGDEAAVSTVLTQGSDGGAVSEHSIHAGDREFCRLRFEWTPASP